VCVTCYNVSRLWIDWVAVGRPFSSIWKLLGTMSMPCVVPEMLWSLDELKRALISELFILKTDVYWMGWNPVKLHNALNLGNCGPESFSQGISGRAYSCGIALEGCHRTPEDSIALHTHTHRSSYSTKGIVYQKNLRIQQRTILEEKTRRRMARERRGAGSSVVSIETLYYKTIY